MAANRLLKFDGQIWKYRVGRCYVVILTPTGLRLNVPCNVVARLDAHNWDRDRPPIRPSDVRIYIEGFLATTVRLDNSAAKMR